MSEETSKSRVDEVAERLRGDILRGVYAKGTLLPGERELSTTLGISRLTLRAAIERLAGEGLIKSVQGSGNRVLDFRESGGVELIGHLVTIAHEGGDPPIDLLTNLLELRRMAAIDAVGFAAARASDAEIEELRANVVAQEAALGDLTAFMERDLRFARLLARATHNLALVLLANTIVRVISQQPGVELTFLVDPRGAVATYRKMVDLIASRKPDDARASARRLLEKFDRGLLAKVTSMTQAANDPPHHHKTKTTARRSRRVSSASSRG